MSNDYEKFLEESSKLVNNLLQGQGSNVLNPSEKPSGNPSGNLTNINNLFHFLLLDKINLKDEIKDKLTRVYEIFSSKSLASSKSKSGSEGTDQGSETTMPKPKIEIPYSSENQNILKIEKIQKIDTDYAMLEKELKNPLYIDKKQMKVEESDPIRSLIEKIIKFSFYEKCLNQGEIMQFKPRLNYDAINNSANIKYGPIERDYFLFWAKELKEWVDTFKPKSADQPSGA
jgi:hypothetical protein